MRELIDEHLDAVLNNSAYSSSESKGAAFESPRPLDNTPPAEQSENNASGEQLTEAIKQQLFSQQLELAVHSIQNRIQTFGYMSNEVQKFLAAHFVNARPEALETARKIFAPYSPEFANSLTSRHKPTPGDDAEAAHIRQAHHRLSEEDQKAIILKKFVRLSKDDIARILRKKPGEIDDSLQRADRKVKAYVRALKTQT